MPVYLSLVNVMLKISKIHRKQIKPTCLSLCKAVKTRPGRDISAKVHTMILQNMFTWKQTAALNKSIHA
ncbi:hypothetical protein C1H46_045461 [Malus baccata]|uniref:Uncharacterized protein n=1 Tax=Malus baccata TaxID=106549 RepID=A0A540K447_MALBA|nr:hypothetical protein C1H46_045461 [Malus baccata]